MSGVAGTQKVNGTAVKSKADRDREAMDKARQWARANLHTRSELAKLPPPEFLIDGIYVARTLADVFGDPGDGKSFVVLDQALCISTGKPWHGRTTRQGKVLYLCGEGASGINARVEAWEAEYNDGRPVPDDAFYMFADVTPLTRQTSDAPRLKALHGIINGLRPDVIVVDTLARYAEGVEENSATDMGRVIAVVDELAKNNGATVILVHHTARGTAHARGSVALKGALETELYVERTKGMNGVITVTKQKNGPDGEEIPFELAAVKDSLVVRTVVTDPFSTPMLPVTGKSPYYKRVAWVLWEVWRDTGGGTKSEVRRALQDDADLRLPSGKKGTRAFFDAWSALERRHYLEPGETGSKFLLSTTGVKELGFTDAVLEQMHKARSQGQDTP